MLLPIFCQRRLPIQVLKPMLALLAVALVLLTAAMVWLVFLFGTAGLVFSLFFTLLSLLTLIVWLVVRNREEHLYRDLPRIEPIRKPLTPANYSVRTNMDPPFFSYESQNYGESRPRTRIKGVPIDRYLELQRKIDDLTQSITELNLKLAAAKAEISVASSGDESGEAPVLVLREVVHEAAASTSSDERAMPLLDTVTKKTAKGSWFRGASTSVSPQPENDSAVRTGPRPPSVVMETLANTQQHLSKLWRRS